MCEISHLQHFGVPGRLGEISILEAFYRLSSPCAHVAWREKIYNLQNWCASHDHTALPATQQDVPFGVLLTLGHLGCFGGKSLQFWGPRIGNPVIIKTANNLNTMLAKVCINH